jgi:two-component system, LytTR family, response regulator
MSTMNCIVIDDECHAVEVMETFIAQTSWLNLMASTTDPLRGVELIREQRPDLVFLDINMDTLTGLDICEIIDKEILTVFCTASSEHAIRSYELSAIDYLLKPCSFKRFTQMAERVHQIYLSRQPQWSPEAFIIAKVDHKGKLIKINLNEIEYIEAKRNYIVFHHGNKKSMPLGSITEMEHQLPATHFMRVHKSFIVSIPQINSLEYGYLTLKNNHQKIPVGLSYKTQLIEVLKRQSLISGI